MVAWFTVASLFIAYIFSFIDRMIIGLLVEPMKADLEISDTQISLLQGLAFAVFYTIAGIPIARLIDRATRVRIVSTGIAVWSLMTMVCGLSQQYWHLFLARIGVGIGEATLSPAAYSIISDSFSPRRLGVAMGVYVLGSSVGAGLAFLIGAVVIALISSTGEVVVPFLGPVRAWQAAFLYVGAPGLLISLLFVFIPEPARRLTGKSAHVAATTLEVWRFSRANARSLLGICIGVGLVNMAAFAAISWLPVLYMRAHGFELAEAGYMAGAALIVGGMIGLLGGGWICDRLGGTPRDRVRVSAWAVAIGIAAGVTFPLVSSATLSAALFVLFFSACSVPAGSAVSAIQQIVPNDMRATVSAVYLFFVSIIGMTLGPTATAMIGDIYFPGGDGIRYAVSIVAGLGMAVATGLLLLAGSVLKRPVNDPRSPLPEAGSPS
ncbi:MFS transporter [Elongatibacter sediminis]|uniref:MFS transporter n=1 Tax=Elongatibacter sediminis TaxID=3119006 RepID=A0AAW9RFP5_9GAMM